MLSAERENHPPVSTLEIAEPRAPAFRLQELFLRSAELPQVRITRNDNPIGLSNLQIQAALHHLSYQGATGRCVRGRQVCIETRVLEELPRRLGDDKAVQRVSRLGLAVFVRRPARFRLDLIHPKQLVRVSHRVLPERKGPREGISPRLRSGAAAKQGRSQQRQDPLDANQRLKSGQDRQALPPHPCPLPQGENAPKESAH